MRLLIPTCILPLLALSTTLRADSVAEWKFDTPPAQGAEQIVTLDSKAEKASAKSQIMPLSSFSPDPTGLGKGWQPFLESGFLDVEPGSGKADANQHGLVTKNTTSEKIYPAKDASYESYMGFSGLGYAETGGTVFLVVSPKDWESGRYSLFGTGHLGGQILLTVNKGELQFTVGQWGSGTLKTQAKLTAEWLANNWYFMAVSWSADQEPVVYVRPMDASGPKASPPAITGTSQGPIPQIDEHPRYDPIVIGARWVNSGGGDSLFTTDGANARLPTPALIMCI